MHTQPVGKALYTVRNRIERDGPWRLDASIYPRKNLNTRFGEKWFRQFICLRLLMREHRSRALWVHAQFPLNVTPQRAISMRRETKNRLCGLLEYTSKPHKRSSIHSVLYVSTYYTIFILVIGSLPSPKLETA